MAEIPPQQDISPESIRSKLGHPNIEIDVEKRGVFCPNCGKIGHTAENCHYPTMDAILEQFGTMTMDQSPASVERKRQILSELMNEPIH